MAHNILYNSIASGRACVVTVEGDLTSAEVYKLIEKKESIPSDLFHLSFNGKTLTNTNDDDILGSKDDGFITLHMYLPTLGGKGGFGSMLRAIGAQIEKTTNKEACRDLSGRRLRDVNAEKKFKEWVSKRAKKLDEEAKRKKAKLLKMRREPKIEFQDEEYFKTRSEIPEKVDEAVEEGIRKVFLAKKFGSTSKAAPTSTVTSSSAVESSPSSSCSSGTEDQPSTSKSVTSGQGKRKECPSASNGNNSKKLKDNLWIGIDFDEDELSDDDEEAEPSPVAK
jgi:hypothetical protein